MIRTHITISTGDKLLLRKTAASQYTGVFLVCTCCLEFSRTLEDPHWIRRRRDRPLCALQARPAHTRQRATGARTMSACLSCVVIL